MNKLRITFAVLLIISLLGISFCNLHNKDYKILALGVLYAIANVLIFLVK